MMTDHIFNAYKRELIRLSQEHGQLRMLCIEYLCQFPSIDPIQMARTLVSEGYDITFDDSSISQAENERKYKLVYGGNKND